MANTNGMFFPMTALGAVDFEGVTYATEAGQVFDARRKEMMVKIRDAGLAVEGDSGNIGRDMKAMGSKPMADVPRETVRAPGYPETGRAKVVHDPVNPQTLSDDNPITLTPSGGEVNEDRPRDESVGAHESTAKELHAEDTKRAEAEQTGTLTGEETDTQNADGSVKNKVVDKTGDDAKTKAQGAGTKTVAEQDAKAGTSKSESGTHTTTVRRTRT